MNILQVLLGTFLFFSTTEAGPRCQRVMEKECKVEQERQCDAGAPKCWQEKEMDCPGPLPPNCIHITQSNCTNGRETVCFQVEEQECKKKIQNIMETTCNEKQPEKVCFDVPYQECKEIPTEECFVVPETKCDEHMEEVCKVEVIPGDCTPTTPSRTTTTTSTTTTNSKWTTTTKPCWVGRRRGEEDGGTWTTPTPNICQECIPVNDVECWDEHVKGCTTIITQKCQPGPTWSTSTTTTTTTSTTTTWTTTTATTTTTTTTTTTSWTTTTKWNPREETEETDAESKGSRKRFCQTILVQGVPREICFDIPDMCSGCICENVPQDVCISIPVQKCRVIPKPPKCIQIPQPPQVRATCKNVPIQNCYNILREICVRPKLTKCHEKMKHVCVDVPTRKCNSSMKMIKTQICHPKNVRKCIDVPRTDCTYATRTPCILSVFNETNTGRSDCKHITKEVCHNNSRSFGENCKMVGKEKCKQVPKIMCNGVEVESGKKPLTRGKKPMTRTMKPLNRPGRRNGRING